MALPPTYYDFMRKVRPTLVENAELDAAQLLNDPSPPQAIHSVDDFDSRFHTFIEKMNAQALGFGPDHPGLSAEELAPILATWPQHAKATFASFLYTLNHEYHCAVNFALAGKKVFHFSDNLADHLANTEINVRAPLVELPFRTCMFTFTSRSVVNAMHNIRGDAGRWAMNVSGLDYTAPISVFLTLHPAGAGLTGRKLVMCAWHAKLPHTSHLALKREIYLDDNWTLEQALRTDWETLTPNDLGIGMAINIGDELLEQEHDDAFYTDGLAFYRIILNAVLYLSSDKAELSATLNPRREIEDSAMAMASPNRRRKLMQTTSRYTAWDYREVGSSIGPIVIQQGETEAPRSGHTGGKPTVRFMVRGHWRRLPKGPDGQQGKLIRIQPYYKGPDIAEAINKPYLVK